MQNLDLSGYLSINYPNFEKKTGCLYYNIPKQKQKNVCFGNFSFHWLEIKQIEKILIKISNFSPTFRTFNSFVCIQ